MYQVTESSTIFGRKANDATKSFKPIIQKANDKKRKSKCEDNDDNVMTIINSTNDKKNKKKKILDREEESEWYSQSPRIKENPIVVEDEDDENKNVKSENKRSQINIAQIDKALNQLVCNFNEKEFVAEGLHQTTPYLFKVWKFWHQAVGRSDYVNFNYDNDLFTLNKETILDMKELILWNGSSEMFDKKIGLRLAGIRRHLFEEDRLLISFHGGQNKYKTLNKMFIIRYVLPYISIIRGHFGKFTDIKFLCNHNQLQDLKLKPPFFGRIETVEKDYLFQFYKDCSDCSVPINCESDQESE